MRREGTHAAQIQHEWLLPQDEALGVLAYAIDVRVVDVAGDRHHGGELTAACPDLGAGALECRIPYILPPLEFPIWYQT